MPSSFFEFENNFHPDTTMMEKEGDSENKIHKKTKYFDSQCVLYSA
jgi:hypothetical protein